MSRGAAYNTSACPPPLHSPRSTRAHLEAEHGLLSQLRHQRCLVLVPARVPRAVGVRQRGLALPQPLGQLLLRPRKLLQPGLQSGSRASSGGVCKTCPARLRSKPTPAAQRADPRCEARGHVRAYLESLAGAGSTSFHPQLAAAAPMWMCSLPTAHLHDSRVVGPLWCHHVCMR